MAVGLGLVGERGQTGTEDTVESAYRIGRAALLQILARGSFPNWKRLTLAAE